MAVTQRYGEGQRILITGGAGFVPSHLVDALIGRGVEVVAVDNFVTGSKDNVAHLADHPRFTLVEADVSDGLPQHEPALAARFDAIMHFASPASPTDFELLPVEILRVGSVGTLHLLERAVHDRARFIMASTSEAYGDPLVHPQTEEYWGNVNPNGVRSVYDEAKRFGEALVMHYYRAWGLDARIVRIFNTYGPHSRRQDGRVIPNLLTQALRGEPLTLYGDGAQTRSFCYVSDLVRGIRRAMLAEGTTGGVFNLGNPDEYSINLFADMIERLFSTGARRDYRPLPVDDPTRRRPDISRARRLLGWEPRVDLEDGLRRTAAWFEALVNRPAPSAPDRVIMADG